MKRPCAAYSGTPGTQWSFLAAVGVLVVIDRKHDSWERTTSAPWTADEERFAIQHEPSREFITAATRAAARAEAERLANLSRADLFNEMRSWAQGG